MSVEIEKEERIKFKKPSKYNIILLNDNYTTVDFVVLVLTQIFNYNENKAQLIAIEIHSKGKSVIGVFTYEVAITRISFLDKLAREHNYPLKAMMKEIND